GRRRTTKPVSLKPRRITAISGMSVGGEHAHRQRTGSRRRAWKRPSAGGLAPRAPASDRAAAAGRHAVGAEVVVHAVVAIGDELAAADAAVALSGLKMRATRVTLGTICLSVSSILPKTDSSKSENPVKLPPGRARFVTTPCSTGSETAAKTIGRF